MTDPRESRSDYPHDPAMSDEELARHESMIPAIDEKHESPENRDHRLDLLRRFQRVVDGETTADPEVEDVWHRLVVDHGIAAARSTPWGISTIGRDGSPGMLLDVDFLAFFPPKQQ